MSATETVPISSHLRLRDGMHSKVVALHAAAHRTDVERQVQASKLGQLAGTVDAAALLAFGRHATDDERAAILTEVQLGPSRSTCHGSPIGVVRHPRDIITALRRHQHGRTALDAVALSHIDHLDSYGLETDRLHQHATRGHLLGLIDGLWFSLSDTWPTFGQHTDFENLALRT